jgi:hypothetical protein
MECRGGGSQVWGASRPAGGASSRYGGAPAGRRWSEADRGNRAQEHAETARRRLVLQLRPSGSPAAAGPTPTRAGTGHCQPHSPPHAPPSPRPAGERSPGLRMAGTTAGRAELRRRLEPQAPPLSQPRQLSHAPHPPPTAQAPPSTSLDTISSAP